jgi:phytol kinase
MFGILVMLLEAVSLRGTDNLLIPFGGYLLLAGFLRRGAGELLVALLVALLLLVLVLVLRKRRTLSDTAVLAAALFGFVAWAVGGWRWLVPPIALFLSYTALWPRARMVRQRPHDLVAVIAVVSSALFWIIGAFVLGRPDFYYPYTISLAANLCFVGISWFRTARPRMHPLLRVVQSTGVAWAAIFPLYAMVAPARQGVLVATLAAVLWLLLGGIGFTWLVPPRPGLSHDPYPWLRQSIVGLAASLLGLAILPSQGVP